MSRKTKNAIGTTIRVLVLVFFFLLVVLPIYWIVITSFKTSGEILDLNNITFFPKDFTLENYTGLFEQFHYGVLLKNSLLVSVASALVVTVFSMLGGYSLARYKFRGKQTVVLFFLITLIGKYNVEWGLLMAGGVMALIPTALMFAVMQKFIVEGMTAGAVKE